MDSEKLKEQLMQKNEYIFAAVIESYSKLLWSVAGGIIYPHGSTEDIEECVSDVFFELWKNPQKYNSERGSLKSYLCIMAKTRALDINRKLLKNNTVLFEDAKTEPAYEDDIVFDDYSALYSAIGQIKEPTKTILLRRYFNNEKPAEISKKMKLPRKEVENRLYRGRQALKNMLAPNTEEV